MPLSWEEFENNAKEAFVATPDTARFFFKTKRTNGGKTVVYTARVRHCATGKATKTEVVHKYQSSETSHLPRITRLLRFGVQEMLGPTVFAHSPMSPTSPRKPLQESFAKSSVQTVSSASGSNKKKKKSKGKH